MKNKNLNEIKNYESYNSLEYTVKKGDTLYSILNKLGKENNISKLLIKNAISSLDPTIKPGDKISFELEDNHTAAVYINWKEHIINLESPEKKEFEKIKKEVNDHQKEIKKNLDETLIKINKTIDELIKLADSLDTLSIPDGFYDKIISIQKTLYSPNYIDNPEAIKARDIIDILALPGDASLEESINTISKVLDNPKIPYQTKMRIAKYIEGNYILSLSKEVSEGIYMPDYEKWLKLAKVLFKKYPDKFKDLDKVIAIMEINGSLPANEIVKIISEAFDSKYLNKKTKQEIARFLREEVLGYLTTDNMSDPLKWVNVANELTKKYPHYDFENFRLVSDPEGGPVYVNDIRN